MCITGRTRAHLIEQRLMGLGWSQLMLVLILNIRCRRSRNICTWKHVLSHLDNRLMVWLTILHHKRCSLWRWCVDIAHQRRLWVDVRRITDGLLVLRLICLRVTPVDTYLFFSCIFVGVNARCMVIFIILLLLGFLRVLPNMDASIGLVGVISTVSIVFSVWLLISILWTISTTMTVITTATR